MRGRKEEWISKAFLLSPELGFLTYLFIRQSNTSKSFAIMPFTSTSGMHSAPIRRKKKNPLLNGLCKIPLIWIGQTHRSDLFDGRRLLTPPKSVPARPYNYVQNCARPQVPTPNCQKSQPLEKRPGVFESPEHRDRAVRKAQIRVPYS